MLGAQFSVIVYVIFRLLFVAWVIQHLCRQLSQIHFTLSTGTKVQISATVFCTSTKPKRTRNFLQTNICCMTNSDSSPRFIPHHRQASRLKFQLLFCVPPPNQRGRGISYRLIFAVWVTQLLWQTAPKIYYPTTPIGRQPLWGTRRPDAAIHLSPTLVCSMLSFVCMVHMLQPSLQAQLVTHITRHYCHHVRLLSCPTLSPSSSMKYVQQ